MNVLALDLGTHTGWALSEHGRIESGVQTFDVKRGESPGMRYLRFRRWLEEVAGSVGLIVYEQTHHRGGAATEVAANFAGRVQEYCAQRSESSPRRIEHAAVHTATLKKFWTGSGRGDKAAMRIATERRGIKVNVCADDNEVDAVALLHYALEELVGVTVRVEER